MDEPPPDTDDNPDNPPPPQPPREYTTETLFGNAREVLIRHREQIYRLRITAADKLILTK